MKVVEVNGHGWVGRVCTEYGEHTVAWLETWRWALSRLALGGWGLPWQGLLWLSLRSFLLSASTSHLPYGVFPGILKATTNYCLIRPSPRPCLACINYPYARHRSSLETCLNRSPQHKCTNKKLICIAVCYHMWSTVSLTQFSGYYLLHARTTAILPDYRIYIARQAIADDHI